MFKKKVMESTRQRSKLFIKRIFTLSLALLHTTENGDGGAVRETAVSVGFRDDIYTRLHSENRTLSVRDDEKEERVSCKTIRLRTLDKDAIRP